MDRNSLYAKEISDKLETFTGSQNYSRHPSIIPVLIITEGVRYLVDSCGCAWFIDIILSMQFDPIIQKKKKLRDVQFWTLTVNKDFSAEVACTWLDEKKVFTKHIKWTDFPLAEIRVGLKPWSFDKKGKVAEFVAYLPSED